MRITLWVFVSLFGLVLSMSLSASNKNEGSVSMSNDVIVLDVRTAKEFEESHVKSAQNIDILESDFENKTSKLDKSKNYKLYCRSGNRSGRALDIMKTAGFKNVENLGSLKQATEKLKQTCEGKQPC